MRALLLSLLACSLSPVAAQASASEFPYLTAFLPLSAEAQAVAEAGAFGPTSDPLRMLDNPAVLADFAGGASLTGDRLPRWLGFPGYSSTALGIAGGTQTQAAGVPVSVGIGLAYASVRQPSSVATDDQGNVIGDFDPGLDQSVAFGAGGAVDGPLRIRAGASLRHYVSSAIPREQGDDTRARSLTADLGLDVTAPVGRWIMPSPDGGFQLVADVTAGYALRGLELTATSVPSDFGSVSGQAGRTPSAGVHVLVGFDTALGTRLAFRGASFEFMTTSDDPGAELWGMSARSVLLGTADENGSDLARRGYRLTLAETLTFSGGSSRGASFVGREGQGATFSLGGALRLAGLLGAGDGVHDLGRRFDVRYTYAAYTFPGDVPFDRTVGHGLTLRVRP